MDDVCNMQLRVVNWNLGFLRGFNEWEIEDVINLYQLLQSKDINKLVEDRMKRNNAKTRHFSVKSYCDVKAQKGADRTSKPFFIGRNNNRLGTKLGTSHLTHPPSTTRTRPQGLQDI